VGDQAGRLVNVIKAHKLVSSSGAAEIASVKLVSGTQSIMLTADGFKQLHRAVTDATRRALRPILPPSTGFDELLRSMLLLVADRARADFVATGNLESVASLAFDWLGFSRDRTTRNTTLNAVVEVLLDERWGSNFDVPDAKDHGRLREQYVVSYRDPGLATLTLELRWLSERWFHAIAQSSRTPQGFRVGPSLTPTVWDMLVSRHSRGERPYAYRKTRLKCAGSANPH
jgi:hypothetical protein